MILDHSLSDKRCTCNDGFWEWFVKSDRATSCSALRICCGATGASPYYAPRESNGPPATPDQFLIQKQKRIARQQIDQRNDRIKAWEDKRKRFK